MTKKQNVHFTEDNLYVMYGMDSEIADLIYLDPPFNSKRMYSAPVGSKAAGAQFNDMWTWSDVDEACLEGLYDKNPELVNFIRASGQTHGHAMMSYLTYMGQRFLQLHRILKSTGTLYLHCDPTASHYLKILLDGIFGKNSGRNEIIWHYPSMSRTKQDFPRKHDVIFRYTKSNEFTFNSEDVLIPYKESTLARAKHGGAGFARKEGKADYLNKDGKVPDTVWEIPHVKSKKEHTGYPTQKPLKLLERIITASSNKGDLVFDPFAGCATTCVAAQKLQRQWIGIDISEKSSELIVERLKDDAGIFTDFIHRTDVPQRSDIEKEQPTTSIKEKLYKEQKGKCNGCSLDMEIKNFEIDHIVPKSKGGGDYYDNYQLLCGNCNRVKGDRPMEYLLEKYKARNEAFSQITFGNDKKR